ncbi:hypothetical protein BH09BAC3_BH09BAC3_35910 [soil metagenome]
MTKLFFLILFSILTTYVFAQQQPDSSRLKINKITTKASGKVDSLNSKISSVNILSINVPGDSTSQKAIHKADSIRSGFQSKADSLQRAYQMPINKLDSVAKSLQHQAKILTSMNIPSAKVSAKLDSVTKLKTAQLSKLNHKMDSLKAKANKSLNSLDLPPGMKEPVQKLTQSINGYKIPTVDGKIPNVNLPSANLPGNLNMPSLGNTNIPAMGNAQLPTGAAQLNIPGAADLTKITGDVGKYGADVKNITQGNLNDVKGLDKKLEGEAMKSAPMGELTGKTAELDKYKSQLNGRPDSAAFGMVKQEVMKEATNHFAGKEEILKQAMDKMAKLKTKYSDVKSMADLAKKPPSAFHDKPFIERLVTGITFQVISTGNYLLDINPAVLYKISPRFSAGGGWVQRIAFDQSANSQQVYGPRAAVQFNLQKGFSLRYAPEMLNTLIPPQYNFSADAGKRLWVWSHFVGIKKEFKIYKSVRGNTEALYNLYNPNHLSPYGDQLVVRIGFEMEMKKRKKKI